MLGFFNQVNLNVSEKPDHTLVTEADKALNEFFIDRLLALVPGSRVIGEEQSSVHSSEAHSPLWLVDPLDGTREFVERTEEWSLMLTLFEPTLGFTVSVISHPTKNTFCWAERGGGAYEKNLQSGVVTRLLVDDVPLPSRATLLRSKRRADPVCVNLREKIEFGKVVPQGSIGLKALSIARGDGHFYLNSQLKCGPWDLAPCQLFLQESGAQFWSRHPINWPGEFTRKNFQHAFAFSTPLLLVQIKSTLEALTAC